MKSSIPICRFGLRLAVLFFALCIPEGPVLGALAGDASDRFYDPEVVQTIHLEIKLEDLDRLRRALPRRIHVPGVFRWNDRTLQHVGVRYKGNSSAGPDSSHKRAFLIAFSEFQKGQRFLGLRHVALDNGIQFGSLFSERLITDAQPQPMHPTPDPEGPKPGPPSADAPSDLRAVKVTPSGVELRWTDHAEGEVAVIVQRCTGVDGTDFANAIGQGGQDITTASDRDVQPGKTYRYRVYAVRSTPQGPRGTGVSNVITIRIPEN